MPKYEHLIQKPYSSTSEYHESHHTKSHHDDLMPRWTFCGDGYFTESPIRVVVRQVKAVPDDYQPHIDLHTHDVDELYVFISEEDKGLEVDLTLGNESYKVVSPAVVLLPKNIPHKYAAKKGHGFVFTLVNIKCSTHYNEHTFPFNK